MREPNPNDFFAAQQKLKLKKQMPPSRLEIEGLTAEQKALLLDLTDIGLSVVGIFEPTPFADLAGTGLALSRGEYGGAIISALGMFPYLGDLAKLGKLPKLVKVMENVVQMAKADGKFAKVVTPLLEKIKTALDNLPIEKLPQKAQDAVKAIKNKIDDFFGIRKMTKPALTPSGQKAVTLDTLEHIFHGELNKKGKAVGFHYEGVENMQAVNKTRTVTVTKPPDKNGVYEAIVEVKGKAKKGNGGVSTFFPKNWTKNDVVNSINEAYINKISSGGNGYIGTSDSGVKIQMFLKPDGTIITAYPLHGK